MMKLYQRVSVVVALSFLAQDVHAGLFTRGLATATEPNAYTVPAVTNDSVARANAIGVKRGAFLYGPPVAGGPFFPNGTLGGTSVATDYAEIEQDTTYDANATSIDTTKATADAAKFRNLTTLDDYVTLYDGEWTHILPHGPAPGILANYTQDLLFSMERLSISPYSVRRLAPCTDTLPIDLDDDLSLQISGLTLNQLFHSGRLFYADYRSQIGLASTGSYSAACDAYFYIHPKSAKFLPLAIRTNVGANLTYTPADNARDWLLAKMMFNVNDLWFSQWHHLANTHEVVQIAYMAAIRTLSDDHPVLALLNRMMYEVFSIQPFAKDILFAPGTAVDTIFAFTGTAAQNFTTALYKFSGAGQFQSNYFEAELARRGLYKSKFGPALKSFPFQEDATVIHSAQRHFLRKFVNAYYDSDDDVFHDFELQNWTAEANGPAQALDFPCDISSKRSLIDILTHMAHLVSTAHHAVNTNELLTVSTTFPFHPAALYQPIPTQKGVINVVDFLPPFAKVLDQFEVAAVFARPQFIGTNRTLLHMFNDQTMLSRMKPAVRKAATKFKGEMQQFSTLVGARTFDARGLSQGMPFVWQALDPNVAPFSIVT